VRHNRRRRYRHPKADYRTPTLLRGGVDEWGQTTNNWQDAGELPEAIFAPGASGEDQMLSEASTHRAQLFWDEHVDIRSDERVRLPEPTGSDSVWSVVGRPNHWRLGTVVNLEWSS